MTLHIPLCGDPEGFFGLPCFLGWNFDVHKIIEDNLSQVNPPANHSDLIITQISAFAFSCIGAAICTLPSLLATTSVVRHNREISFQDIARVNLHALKIISLSLVVHTIALTIGLQKVYLDWNLHRPIRESCAKILVEQLPDLPLTARKMYLDIKNLPEHQEKMKNWRSELADEIINSNRDYHGKFTPVAINLNTDITRAFFRHIVERHYTRSQSDVFFSEKLPEHSWDPPIYREPEEVQFLPDV